MTEKIPAMRGQLATRGSSTRKVIQLGDSIYAECGWIVRSLVVACKKGSILVHKNVSHSAAQYPSSKPNLIPHLGLAHKSGIRWVDSLASGHQELGGKWCQKLCGGRQS